MTAATLQPLRRKLPLLISAVLAAVVIGVCGSAYYQLRVVLVTAAGQRLLGATQQLATMLEQSSRALQREGHRLASDTAVQRAFERGRVLDPMALSRVLARERRSSRQLVSLGLLDRYGRPIVTVDSNRVTLPSGLSVGPKTRQPADSVTLGTGRLRVVGNRIRYDVSTPVTRAGGDTAGYVVATRESADGAAGQLIGRLIGTDATMLIGNVADGVWTDLAQPVAGPPRGHPIGLPAEYTGPDGIRYITAGVRLQSVPWQVLVRMPRESALAPARRMVWTILAIAVLLLLVGVLLAWRLSRDITGPLAEIAYATGEFAAGNYTRRIDVVRHDELGAVAAAFNAMASRVEKAASEMELRERQLRATNHELRDSEKRYRQLVDLSPEAIIVHRDGTILFGNPAAARLLGADSASAFAGRVLLDFLPADQHASATERFRRVSAGGAAPWMERTLRRLDGKAVDVETTSQSFIQDGAPAILSIIRDVTEHKRLEAQFRQSQKMEAVGQLAGGVAHDFNNLLTVIMSYSGLLALSAESGSGLARDLGEIRGAAERAAALTHQLLAFSRRQVLQPQVIDLNDLTIRLEGMLRRLVREDIELVTRFDPHLHPVSADPGQLEQVIVNLVLNAGDAMPAGGRLVIETMEVVLDARSPMLPNGAEPGPFVLLSVSDNGHGMDELTRSKIFDPFFTTKDPGKGTGLGLSTAYGIVQQSGGSISVYSEPGLGTTFKIYLPHGSADGVPVSPRTVQPPIAGGSETVLLVEDDARVRGAAQRVLESAGYAVLLATTGAEALALLDAQRERVGLMLTDLVMPEMGGRDLATRVASRWPDMKIVFMSGYTEDAASRASILAPGAQFLDKPFTPETLTGKVRDVLRGMSGPVS